MRPVQEMLPGRQRNLHEGKVSLQVIRCRENLLTVKKGTRVEARFLLWKGIRLVVLQNRVEIGELKRFYH